MCRLKMCFKVGHFTMEAYEDLPTFESLEWPFEELQVLALFL